MAQIAPWLIPTDVVRSASAGANVGLSARARDLQAAAQRQAAMEFAQRLNQQSYQFDRNLAVEQDTAAARLGAALREQDALGAYRQEQMKLAREELRSREGIASERAAAMLLRQGQEPQSIEPEIRKVDGGRLLRRGPQSWQFVADPAATKESVRTAAQWNSYIDDLSQRGANESPEQKANRLEELKVAREERRKLMLPELQPLVPQITPGVKSSNPFTRDIAPVTNFVPAKASAPVTAIDPDTVRAQFKAGQISRAEAIALLRGLGFTE